MQKADSTTNNHTPHAIWECEEAFPARKLSCRVLVAELRPLIDKVTDPIFRHRDPATWAKDYGLLVSLLHTQKIDTKHIRHNLGRRRWGLIEKIRAHVKEQIEKGSLGRKKT